MQPDNETPLTTAGLSLAMRDMPQRVIGVGPIHAQRPSRVFLAETTDLITRMLPNLINGEIGNMRPRPMNELYVPLAMRVPARNRTGETTEFLTIGSAIQTAAEQARFRGRNDR